MIWAKRVEKKKKKKKKKRGGKGEESGKTEIDFGKRLQSLSPGRQSVSQSVSQISSSRSLSRFGPNNLFFAFV